MILPFGLGMALAVPLYNEFIDDSVRFTHFMLFVGVAFSITAFPVLCRILTELQMLDTSVGVVVLSAGVGNDVVGWVLLALTVALVNAGSGLTAVYILLVCTGFSLVLLFPGRWFLHWLATKTGSFDNGPSMVFMTVTILLLFASAFFTDIIGVHAIFGAFIVGVIVPREGHLAIMLTEKLEDLVSIVFLPLYFTFSGLSTKLGLLDNGKTWGYTVAVCLLAFVGKFAGCFFTAKFMAGFNARESSAIGTLMSCKGLVELIVLNVGLNAKILSEEVFAMFVLQALVLTFVTTPMTTVLYPPRLRVRVGFQASHPSKHADVEATAAEKTGNDDIKTRFTIVLDKLEHVPGMMALAQLIQPPFRDNQSSPLMSQNGKQPSPVSLSASHDFSVQALRLIELTDRTSAVMRSSAVDALVQSDPVLRVFRMYGRLNNLPITPSLAIVPYSDLSDIVADHATSHRSHMIMVPWLPPHAATVANTNTNVADEIQLAQGAPDPHHTHIMNPFDMLFKNQGVSMAHDSTTSAIHSQFIRGVFARANVDVALFVDQSNAVAESMDHGAPYHHLVLPFFGGPDDRLALTFVAQCCENPRVVATIIRIYKTERGGETIHERTEDASLSFHRQEVDKNVLSIASVGSGGVMPDTFYGVANTETRMHSDTADNIIWAKYTSQTTDATIASQRMTFKEVRSSAPLYAAIYEAGLVAGEDFRKVIVVGRSKRMAVVDHEKELKGMVSAQEKTKMAAEVQRTIGNVGTAFVVSGDNEGIVVVQAAVRS